MHDGVIFIDSNRQVLLWNRGAERLTGIHGESIIQRPLLPEVLRMRDERGKELTDEECPVADCLQSRTQTMRRLVIRGRSGEDLAIDAQLIPVVTNDGLEYGVTLILHDASGEASLVERCQSLMQKAIRDPLTQLANRAEFDRVHTLFVSVHAQRRLPCSLIICDIDRFKQVNDVYGHLAGDDVIRSFAGALKNHCRPGDLVARYGGEEFVMLCADCNNATGYQRAEQIRKAFAEMPQPAMGNRGVTASFGVTEIQPGDDAETMLRRADRALLQAKDSGRNMVVQLGAGGAVQEKRERRSWWPWSTALPDALIKQRLVTRNPLKLTIEKLRGFVADRQAQIVHIDGTRVQLNVEADRMLRRSTDRPVALTVEVDLSEERVKGASNNGQDLGLTLHTRIHVTIRPRRGRDRRRHGAADRAREVLTSLRSYLMAAEETDGSQQ
jgi:diguanylate cyclase (GGDEF)-like protein